MAGREGLTDFYAVLEVAPHARLTVIEAAFVVLREAALAADGDDALARLVELNRAHAVLSDTGRRREYDALRCASE
jgi:curved DNA-binding protein CbpA